MLRLPREHSGCRQIPGGIHARMDEGDALALNHERPGAEPVDELVAVGGRQNVGDGVAAMNAAGAGGYGEQMKIVIPEKRFGAAPEALHKAKRFKRFRAAVHNVAEEKKFSIFRDLFEQSLQAFKTSLKISDREKFARHAKCPPFLAQLRQCALSSCAHLSCAGILKRHLPGGCPAPVPRYSRFEFI